MGYKYTEQDIIDINERNHEIADKLGFIGTADCLVEELGELVQAICKYKRSLGYGQPTPKSIEECKDNLIEEMADVRAGLLMLQYLLNVQENDLIGWNSTKSRRGLERLAARDKEDKNSKLRANIMIKLINDPNKLDDEFKSIIEYAEKYGARRSNNNDRFARKDKVRIDEGTFDFIESEESIRDGYHLIGICTPYYIDRDLSEDKYEVVILHKYFPVRISIKNDGTISFDKWVTIPDRFFYVATSFMIHYLDKIKEKEKEVE